MAEGRNADELEELDIQIGMTEDPDDWALRELRKHQEAMGMAFENPDAPVADTREGEVPAWMTRDEEFR